MLSRRIPFFFFVLIFSGCSAAVDTPEEAKKAFQLAAEGKAAKAAKLLADAAKKNPKNGLYPFYQGRLASRHFNEIFRGNIKFLELKKLPHKPFGQYLEMKNPDGSIAGYQYKDLSPVLAFYKKAIRLKPDLTDAYIECAMLYASMFKLPQAQKLLKQGAKRMPDNYRLPFLRAYLYRHTGDFANAVRMYKKAAAIDPDRNEIHLYRGTLALKMGETALAEKFLTKVIEKNDNSKDVQQALRGLILHHYLKGLKGSTEAFRNAVRIGDKFRDRLKKNPRMMIRLGKAAYLAGDSKRALFWLKAGLDEVPTDPQALTFLGELQEKHGKNAEAAATWRRALAVRDTVHTRYLLGSLLLRRGKAAESLVHLKKAAAGKKNAPLILYSLAKAVSASGAPAAEQQTAWKNFLKAAVPAKFDSRKIAEARSRIAR